MIRFCAVIPYDCFYPFYYGKRSKIRVIRASPNLDAPSNTSLNHPLIQQGYQLVYDNERPDIVFLDLSCHLQSAYQYNHLALAARRKFGWSPLMIAPYYENPKLSALRYLDKTFSSEPPNSKNITLGLGIPWLFFQDRTQYLNAPKPKFCNFLYSGDYLPYTGVRRAFCKLLMRYKHIDCPSKSLNNTLPVSLISKIAPPVKDKISFFKDYKFTIAFENEPASGYITEKIVHPLAVGSIPIYWGSSKIANYFNPKAFINCHDYQNFEQVVERVIEIDNDPDLYARYIQAPPTVPGNYYHDLVTKMRSEWKALIAQALERRQQKKSWLYTHARLGWMLLSHLPFEIAEIRRILTPRFLYRQPVNSYEMGQFYNPDFKKYIAKRFFHRDRDQFP